MKITACVLLRFTRLAAEYQSVNNSSKAAVMLTKFFHEDGCRELNRELHKLLNLS